MQRIIKPRNSKLNMKSIVSWGIDNKIIPNFKKKLKIYVYKSLKRVSRLSLNHISFASTQSKENITEGFVIWMTFFLFFIRSIWKCVLVFKSVSWLWSAFNLSRLVACVACGIVLFFRVYAGYTGYLSCSPT